mgnify:CR=1 FL=1
MDKFFKISERGSNVKTEIIAVLTTFFAMAYIVITNPNQTTSCSTDRPLGQIWNAVYVASILVAIIGTLLMALYAKMPFAQACGMGLNSFFFVSFILPAVISGSDAIDGYQSGLVIILVSGLVFLLFKPLHGGAHVPAHVLRHRSAVVDRAVGGAAVHRALLLLLVGHGGVGCAGIGRGRLPRRRIGQYMGLRRGIGRPLKAALPHGCTAVGALFIFRHQCFAASGAEHGMASSCGDDIPYRVV